MRDGEVIDITRTVPTTADLFDRPDAVALARTAPGESLGRVEPLLQVALDGTRGATHLLAPCDVQAIKACGVTFAVSLIERVIEEQAGGDPVKQRTCARPSRPPSAPICRRSCRARLRALRLKAELERRGAWSPMEVGIGPDAEVF